MKKQKMIFTKKLKSTKIPRVGVSSTFIQRVIEAQKKSLHLEASK